MDELSEHLPKILDLARNFDIDLSGVLSSYAQKLRDNVPELTKDFSFPRAALLLQHCTEIYGRKVDYVHSLALDLSENVNVGMYRNEPEQSAQNTPENVSDPVPRKTVNTRRRKTGGDLCTEDFRFQEINLDYPPKIVKKKREKRKHCRETGYGRLLNICIINSHEHEIYEDEQLAPIGTKDQYRLNWHIDQSCRMEEHIMNRGAGSRWDVCDVGVANMLTPEHSNDGIENSEAFECSNPLDAVEIPDSDNLDDLNNVLVNVAVCPAFAQESGGDLNLELPDILKPYENKFLPEKPAVINQVFKLPSELTEKGIREAGTESSITMFLFSNLLKRTLKMGGLLPPPSSDRHAEKKLIARHIQYLFKRYNLGNRKAPNLEHLTQPQVDFLGFEEEILPDVPEVLSYAYDENGGEALEESTALTTKSKQSEDRLGSQHDLDDTGTCEENYELDVLQTMMDYNNRRKSTIDIEGISEWRNHIQTKLKDTEQQRKFDVHEYGTDIIGSFKHIGQTLGFGEMVGGLESSEVCRYFVSTLMLANTANLELQDSGLNTLKMTLKSTERHHEMEDILVPPAAGGMETNVPAPPFLVPSHNSGIRKRRRNERATASRPSKVLSVSTSTGRQQLIANPLPISEQDLMDAGPSGTQMYLDSSIESELDSRMSNQNDDDASSVLEDELQIWKQKPGTGPWINKSKKNQGE